MSSPVSDALLAGCLRLLRAGRLRGSYLIVAPPAPARAFVRELLAAYVCAQKRSCGICAPCRMVLADAHPDFPVFRPEPGKSLGTDVVLGEILPAAALSPRDAPLRVLLMAEADRLTSEAQSRLLKALEEPAPHCLWLLTSERPQRLHATILSRCQRLALPATADLVRTDAPTAPRRARLGQALERARASSGNAEERLAAAQRLGAALRSEIIGNSGGHAPPFGRVGEAPATSHPRGRSLPLAPGPVSSGAVDEVLAEILSLLRDSAAAGDDRALAQAECALAAIDALENHLQPELVIDALCDTIIGLTPPSRLLDALGA